MHTVSREGAALRSVRTSCRIQPEGLTQTVRKPRNSGTYCDHSCGLASSLEEKYVSVDRRRNGVLYAIAEFRVLSVETHTSNVQYRERK